MSDPTNEEQRAAYDKLIHLLTEAKLPHAEVKQQAKLLFPGFDGLPIYDEVIGSYEIERFADARGKGLSIEESAHAAEVSHFVMQRALKGEGLSLERFVELIKGELFAVSQLITKLLNVMETAESAAHVNAAAMLLEKVAPGRYGKGIAMTATGKDENKQGVVLNFTVAD